MRSNVLLRLELCLFLLFLLAGAILAPGVSAQGPLTDQQRADVNYDGVVDAKDLAIVRAAVGKRAGQAGYDARFDFDGNGQITVADLNFVTRFIGQRAAPPVTIVGTVSPAPNAAGWNRTDVTVSFACANATSCPGPIAVSMEGASQTVTGTAVGAGGTATTQVTVQLDKTAPAVAFTAPADNTVTDTSPVVVRGTFPAGGSPPVSAVCNGAAGTLDVAAHTFDCRVPLQPGANPIVAEVTDAAGNAGSATLHVTYQPTSGQLPTITGSVSPPPNAAGWHQTDVTVTFTCTNATSCQSPIVVTTEGQGQVVSGTASGPGGVATTAVTLNIDKTAPVASVALSPAPNGNGFYNGPVTAHFTCADPLSGIVSCPPDQVVANEGAGQTVSGTAADLAGNVTVVTSAAFSIDARGPTMTVSLSPPPNANGWNRTPVTAHFTCSDAVSGVASCPADQTVSAESAGQTITGAAIDRAGNTATASATVRIDTTPPVLMLESPATGSIVFTSTVTATGTATDGTSGIDRVTCAGAPALVNGASISCALTLARGPNSFDLTAIDLAGNTSTLALGLNYTRVPVVTLTAPANLGYLNISPTTVTGTVDDPTATVSVNSVPAVTANGSFSLALPLAEGPNIITATASSGDGAVGTASVQVTLDTTPPHVTITSPPDQFVTTDAAIGISGTVNDIVVGTVNAEQAQVSVNGADAQVANRMFNASAVPLAIGPNLIQAVARDRVGNSATTQITVTRQVPSQPQIHLVSGNNQSGAIGSLLPAPLVVSIANAGGTPLPNTQVIFKVTQNDGVLGIGSEAGPRVIANTDAQGQARVQWTLGHRAGAGGNTVEAYAVGFDGTALFTATGTQGAPGIIVVDTGNDQIGAVGQPLPKPFIAVVVDEGHNRLAGVPVTFTVQQGGGSFDGQDSLLVTSDSDGRVAATLTLGLQEGNANNVVEANFPGNEFAAVFAASGRAPGNPANTTISGVVLDNSNVPIPGVTVRAVLTNVLHSNALAVQAAASVQTDAEGQFSLGQAPIGFVKLLVDGSTAQRPGVYPSLEYDVVTVAGQNNTVGQPMYLLALDTANQLCVSAETGGGTLTIPDAPGFSLTFGPGQVTFPGGSKTGCVSVTVVHGDKVPMVPGFGQQPRFIVTIQPSGAAFNPPAAITLPNVDGLAPRAVTEMYSFDHDIGSFVAIGTGTVSDDGLVIRSNPGVGVLKAGWHCGGNPSANGTVADCPACQSCQTNHCVADDSHKPPEKCSSCNSGMPVPPQTDAQCCATALAADPSNNTSGYVVCCNGSKTVCIGPGAFPAGDAGQNIIRACVVVHEQTHFNDVDCPTGAAECTTTQPPFKPGRSREDGECDATKAEIACLNAADCTTVTSTPADLATCRAKVRAGLADAKAYANGIKPGCVP